MERTILPFSAFLISRSQMPQVDSTKLKDILKSNKIDHEILSKCNVESFKPTQYEYDKYKVNLIKMEWRKDSNAINKTKPIIVSEDGFVLDGHHRYFAALQSNTPIDVLIVFLPINKLLKLVQDFYV